MMIAILKRALACPTFELSAEMGQMGVTELPRNFPERQLWLFDQHFGLLQLQAGQVSPGRSSIHLAKDL
jgi:hypothetical protein